MNKRDLHRAEHDLMKAPTSRCTTPANRARIFHEHSVCGPHKGTCAWSEPPRSMICVRRITA
jgi:hypothetical protein